MSETYEVYAEMIETLRQAQAAVRLEVEGLSAQALDDDGTTLERLRAAVADFDNRARALILMMGDRNVPSELLRMGEDLVHFFEDARLFENARWRIEPMEPQ